MKGAPVRYSRDELRWIEARALMPRRDLHALFVRTWNRPDVTADNIRALCRRKGWKTGRTGRFRKGQAPHNKGKAMPSHPNSRATQFQPGERRGVAQRLWKPIGTERISEEGYIERKVNDDLPLQARWRAVHLIRWEKAHGPVPDGHCLKCLDGDKTNTDPSNWACIPRAMLPRLNGRFGRNYDTAPPDLKPVILAIARLEHAARETRKTRS